MFAIEITEDEPWRLDARCRDGSASLIELFFSEQLDDIARAKAFCRACPVREACTQGEFRRITVHEHAATAEAVRQRMEEKPELFARRKGLVEHCFGTLKFWMGHAKSNQTEEYVKLFDEVEYRREVVDSMGLGFELRPEKPIVRNVRRKSVKEKLAVAA